MKLCNFLGFAYLISSIIADIPERIDKIYKKERLILYFLCSWLELNFTCLLLISNLHLLQNQELLKSNGFEGNKLPGQPSFAQ